MTFVGDLRNLVRGATKLSGTPNDNDPSGFRKSPGQM
jgi:hypothetical protein